MAKAELRDAQSVGQNDGAAMAEETSEADRGGAMTAPDSPRLCRCGHSEACHYETSPQSCSFKYTTGCGCIGFDPAPLVRGPGASEGDSVDVAVGGTVERSDSCAQCGGQMLYRTVPPHRTEDVVGMFCRDVHCKAWLVESQVPPPVGAVDDGRCLFCGMTKPAPAHWTPRAYGFHDFVAPVGEPAAAAPVVIGGTGSRGAASVLPPLIRDHVPTEPRWKRVLEHQIHRTHKHSPGACDACQDAELLLIPDEVPDDAHERRRP